MNMRFGERADRKSRRVLIAPGAGFWFPAAALLKQRDAAFESFKHLRVGFALHRSRAR
jgi:hypothetical protein